jgi:hypothetical protein
MACLFGLAPDGVCPATDVTTRAVSSYLAISPLPIRLCHPCGRQSRQIGGIFSVALSITSRCPAVSRHPALWSPDFPLRTKCAATVWLASRRSLPREIMNDGKPARACIIRDEGLPFQRTSLATREMPERLFTLTQLVLKCLSGFFNRFAAFFECLPTQTFQFLV